MKFTLRMTGSQHAALLAHLFPGDGNEAVALLLCGRRVGAARHVFTVRRVVTVPYEACERRPDRITWPTDLVDQLLSESYGKGQAIVKVHSHGAGYRRFSPLDDASDQRLFASVTGFLGDNQPHGSLIMFPDGELMGRVLGEDGAVLADIASVRDPFQVCSSRLRSLELHNQSFQPVLILSRMLLAADRSPSAFVLSVIRTSICGSIPASGFESEWICSARS